MCVCLRHTVLIRVKADADCFFERMLTKSKRRMLGVEVSRGFTYLEERNVSKDEKWAASIAIEVSE